jgi:hypothetical protein
MEYQMRQAGLAILYEGGVGRPLTVARVADHSLLVAAAQAAICEARALADDLGETDAVLGAVQHEESERLRRVLGLLVPEVSGAEDHRAPSVLATAGPAPASLLADRPHGQDDDE